MWYLPARFYVTTMSDGRPIAGENYLGFYVDVRRLKQSVDTGELRVVTSSDGEQYVIIRGSWEELLESKQYRIDSSGYLGSQGTFRPLVGYLRARVPPSDFGSGFYSSERFTVSLRLETLYDWFENATTVIIAGRSQAFDRVKMGERAVATLNIIDTSDMPIQPTVSINYPRGF